MLRLSLAGTPKPYVEVSKDHFDILARRHAKSALRGSGGVLRSRALALLLRYQSLGAHGYQAALPPAGFEVLRTKLEVGFECFASPLNATYDKFCSCFGDGDVDNFFGSVGSFFDFAPRRGSFEANPPFVPEVMLQAVKRAEALVEAAEAAHEPLSFCFIVPTWDRLPFHQQLLHSQWLAGEALLLEASSHAFVDGAAHCKEREGERFRPSSFGTTVGLLQSSSAAARWPMSAELRADLAEAFASALPSNSEAARRATRGGGDAVALLLKRRGQGGGGGGLGGAGDEGGAGDDDGEGGEDDGEDEAKKEAVEVRDGGGKKKKKRPAAAAAECTPDEAEREAKRALK